MFSTTSQQTQIRLQLSMVLEAVVSQQLIRKKDGDFSPIFEVMTNSLAVRNQIREAKTHQLNNTIASSEGMISMDSMLMDYYQKDLITLDEALLHSFDSDLFMKKIKSK